jgi:hypothetical protein
MANQDATIFIWRLMGSDFAPIFKHRNLIPAAAVLSASQTNKPYLESDVENLQGISCES